MDEPDPSVVGAARSGDLGAFEDLVRRYQGHVWRLSLHLLHDPDLASDATQEAFVRAYRFLPRYRGESKFSTWLFSIARNCALDEARRAARRRRIADRAEAEPAPPPREPGAAVEVREAVAALPLDLREPIVMIDMFGISYKEVATILGAPEGTIKSRVHRARELLVESLSPRSGEDAGVN
ncbi:MAG: RNA polymerase sigma factor [Actinomycetota bacterium]